MGKKSKRPFKEVQTAILRALVEVEDLPPAVDVIESEQQLDRVLTPIDDSGGRSERQPTEGIESQYWTRLTEHRVVGVPGCAVPDRGEVGTAPTELANERSNPKSAVSVAPLGAGAWESAGTSANGDSPDTSEHSLGAVDDVTGGDGDDPAPGDSGSLGSVVALALYPAAITTVQANTAAVNRFNVIMTPLVRPHSDTLDPLVWAPLRCSPGPCPLTSHTHRPGHRTAPSCSVSTIPTAFATDLGSVAGL